MNTAARSMGYLDALRHGTDRSAEENYNTKSRTNYEVEVHKEFFAVGRFRTEENPNQSSGASPGTEGSAIAPLQTFRVLHPIVTN